MTSRVTVSLWRNKMIAAYKNSTLIFLLVSIGLIVFPHIYNLPPAVFSFFFLLLSWRFLGVHKPNWLPTKPSIFLLTVCGLALLYFQHQGLLGRDAGTSLFVTALALKLLEMRTERDLYLITYLAFIVAATQFLYEQSIIMAVYILFVCCVLLATLVLINSFKARTPEALKTACYIIAQALPIAVVLFVLFPRLEAPQWLLFTDEHQAKMGLSDSMEPGSISNLGLSDELVFRVKFKGALPPRLERYWRGPVLTHTDGKRWTAAKGSDFRQAPDQPVFFGPAYHYTLLMEAQDKNWVFALDLPVEFTRPLRQNANYQLVSTLKTDKRSEYKLTSNTHYNTGAIAKTEYQDSLQLPGAPSGEIKQLVRQLRGFDSAPEDFIRQLLNHFRTENFHYTLTPPLLEEKPIERFLFETRYGFCSHYAAAFVYLMRVANIPARVVTGYQGGEFNKVGNFLEIRQAHAHAWAEVWLAKKGWVRVDPTAAIAPERIEQDINVEQQIASGLVSFAPADARARTVFSWLKQARQLWNSMDYNWQRWVINYNSLNQAGFLSSLGIDDLKTMVYWMIGLIGLITALLSVLLLRRQQSVDPALRIYRRFCKKIAKAGLIRAAGEGAKDFAERIKLTLPEQAADIDHITALFIKLHYGREAGREDLKQLDKCVSALKIEFQAVPKDA